MTGRKNVKSNVRRFLSLGIAFTAILIAHVIVLGVIQANGSRADDDPNVASVRTVTVSGLRGEIYDCNGKLLVGNSERYDLVYEYGAMPDTYNKNENINSIGINGELILILEAIERTSNADRLAEDMFILEGTYPHQTFIVEKYDEDSDEYYYFARLLEERGLEENISAEDLAAYFVEEYKLSSELYTDVEITSLMRIWYEMERTRFGKFQPYTIAEDVDLALMSYVEEAGVEGANFKTVSERKYMYPGIASHILGRVGKITAENADYYRELGYSMDAHVGISGCEMAFEKWLRGEDGVKTVKYDRDGNIIEEYYESEPISGNDVWLTIDIDLQIAAEEGLKKNIETVTSSTGGAITALDPNTGAIKAIASYPTYDLSLFSDKEYYAGLLEDERTPLLNRALSGVYAPGSVYKVGVALAALEEGYADMSTRCTCTGVYDFTGQKCNGVHGTVDVIEAIKESCNIFFYSLGRSMGIDRVTPYTSHLGLGVPTGIEIPEREGVVAGSKYREESGGEWRVGDDVSAAIGQSDHGYTPLQISVYMSSIVNGGKRYSAHLLDSVREFYNTDKIISSYGPVSPVETVAFSQSTYNTLIKAMGQVVSGSNSLSLYMKNVPVAVGGKTGTAQVNGQKDNALFSGFAPLDAPELVVSCVIQEGVTGSNAGIAAAEVFEAYFKEK